MSGKMTSIRRRDILVLASVWVVGCGIVFGLLAVFYSQSQQSPATPQPQATATYTLDFEGDTAKIAYMRALSNAVTWQGDVELIAASAYWPQVPALDALQTTDTWDFRFFSPGRLRTYFAVAGSGKPVVGRAHLYKQTQAQPTLIDPTAWVIDSDEAILIWLNNGGGVFLETFPDSSVEVLLRRLPDSPTLIWDIISVSPDQSQLFYLGIDAQDGMVIK